MATSAALLVLDPLTLQRRATELLAAVDVDPTRAAERIAVAEAHVRLIVLGAERDRASQLLERAIELDPYRADAYLLAALARHREGLLDAALERYEQAVSLDPTRVTLRLHCGFGFLDAARRRSLSDEDAAELADVAAEHFEAALELDPTHVPAALGAIESAIYGKATRLRDSLSRVFSRVAPAEVHLRTMTRLLYQAIFAFRVGKAKGVDEKNKKTMGEIAAIARGWLAAFPSDRGLEGVIAAAAAKCETAVELCERVGEYARAIPDVRILRLLLRERLADVADPKRRLELFEGVMARIPALDGIAHDYLQLMHLVAKRAAAEGNLAAAQAAWTRCETLDPDNPATTQNLLRLALHTGDTRRAAALDRRLSELWAVYAELSPRADVVLSSAAARAQLEVAAEFDGIVQQLHKDGPRPRAQQLIQLVRRWTHAQALARLAAEPALLRDSGATAAAVAALLGGDPGRAHEAALDVLAEPVQGQPPVAYHVLRIPKDAPDELVLFARDDLRERLTRELRQAREAGLPLAPIERFIERATDAIRALTARASRAAYDAATCPAPQAEMYRLHARGYQQLVELAATIHEDDDVSPRERLVSLLRGIPDPIRKPYLAVSWRDEDWVKVMLLRVHFGGVLLNGWQLLKGGETEAVITQCATTLAGASGLAAFHRLYALAAFADSRLSPWEAADKVREHAEAAIRSAHWTDPPQGLDEMRQLFSQPLGRIAQHIAARQALDLLESERSGHALRLLFKVYEGHRHKPAPSPTPAAGMFADLTPSGTGFYAFAVARAIRDSVIGWFSASLLQSYEDLTRNKKTARDLTQAAVIWAKYSAQNIGADALRGEEAAQSRPAIIKLLAQLENDDATLS
ncbi:hypothetical protein [Sorangium sp. So ce861]|uniref:hypothetical protein n=1 Tax=Sorangium sp. So ce861 TaxID=3133323 RepID=UPI003F647EED